MNKLHQSQLLKKILTIEGINYRNSEGKICLMQSKLKGLLTKVSNEKSPMFICIASLNKEEERKKVTG